MMPFVEPETLKLEAAAVSGTSALQSILNFIKNLSENLSTPKITAGDSMKAQSLLPLLIIYIINIDFQD